MWPFLRLREWEEPGVNGRCVTMGEGDLTECDVHVEGDGGKVTGGRMAIGRVSVVVSVVV